MNLIKRHGLTLIELLVVIAIIAIVIAITLPAVQYAREAANRTGCRNQLHQIGLGLHSYLADWGVFPPAYLRGASGFGNGPWSQHVTLLPYLEQRDVYNSLNLDFYWGDSSNTTVTRMSLGVYLCPSSPRPSTSRYGFANYHACSGSGVYSGGLDVAVASEPSDGLFAGTVRRPIIGPADCVDGLSHTAAFSELVLPSSLKEQTSTKAANSLGDRLGYKYGFEVAPPTQRKLLELCDNLDETMRTRAVEFEPVGSPWVNGTRYTHLATPNRFSCYAQNFGGMQAPITASSNHAKGVNVLFADGHVQWMGQDIDLVIWRALATRNGAEVLDSY